jgi:hypothetical protein
MASQHRVPLPKRIAPILPILLALSAVLAPPGTARAVPLRGPAPEAFTPPVLRQAPSDADRDRLWKIFRGYHHNALYPDREAARPNHARAIVELGVILVFETAIYAAISPTQRTDWDARLDNRYPLRRWISFRDVRFDNNAFWYNNVSHPLLGSYYYQVARTNDLGPGGALAVTALGASVWEYICEFREKVSINDLVTTTVAGMALGETVAQLGAFFERGSGHWLHQGLAGLLSPTRALHNHMDKTPPRKAERLDDLGLPADVSHRFAFQAGWSATRTTTTESSGPAWRNDATLDLDLRLSNILGAGAPGTFADHLTEGNVTRLAASVAFGARGLRQMSFLSRAGIVGGYLQDIQADGAGGRRGYSVFFGGATSFDLSAVDAAGLLGGRFDLWSNTGLLGPLIVAEGFVDGWTLTGTFEAYPVFSLVSALALPSWKAAHGHEGLPSILREQGYAFAIGAVALGEFRAEYRGGFEASASVRLDKVWSLNGVDRFQEQVTDDLPTSERRVAYGARVGYRILGSPARVGASVNRMIRTGYLRQFVVQRADTTIGLDLDLKF